MKITFHCPPELSNCLPKPIIARLSLPDWFKSMPGKTKYTKIDSEIPTIKKCPAVVDAMTTGFIIPLPVDIQVRDGQFHWQWDVEMKTIPHSLRTPISFHAPEQVAGSPLDRSGSLIVKFHNFWTIRLEPGLSLLVTHPFNHYDMPFFTLSGVVDADKYSDAFIQFPALWHDKKYEGVLTKGTPLAQCIPIQRDRISMEFGILDGDAEQRFLTTFANIEQNNGVYRRFFRSKDR